jgi:hypothetical protein
VTFYLESIHPDSCRGGMNFNEISGVSLKFWLNE